GDPDSVPLSVVRTDVGAAPGQHGGVRRSTGRFTQRKPGVPSGGDIYMTTTDTPRLDEAALEMFVHQAVGDLAAAISGLMLHLGDRLGLYRAMAGAGPVTPATLAQRTGTHERYVREWLGNQAAGGYVSYDPEEGTFELGAEHALVLADEQSPVFLGGAFETVASCYT